MYQAIVLLPLIGAIVAGAIALLGARNRFPGQDPSPDAGTPPHTSTNPMLTPRRRRTSRMP